MSQLSLSPFALSSWRKAYRRFRVALSVEEHILSVCYDESLLITRGMILQQAGFKVTSALGLIEGIRTCRQNSFDLAIIGHSIPRLDKAAMLQEIRRHCKAPVVSLYTSCEESLPGVDYALDANEGPAALLNVVNQALDGGRRARAA
jgi:DNA-binding NarL/FixJ family response regulator